MKIKTSELTGPALDWVIWLAQEGEAGYPCKTAKLIYLGNNTYFNPSTDWTQGGPIIEREKISPMYEPSQVYDDSCRWKAMCAMSDADLQYGPTPLIAAMRSYVASKLGDEVDVPEELL